MLVAVLFEAYSCTDGCRLWLAVQYLLKVVSSCRWRLPITRKYSLNTRHLLHC